MAVEVGASEIVFETGSIAKQAGGAVIVRQGDTVLLCTVCAEKEPQDVDFVPLRVDYQERYSAAGKTSGGFLKREGRPTDREVLVCRIIDRPLRPMLPSGWTHNTQLLVWVLSYDGINNPDVLAVNAASAALCISEVPLSQPVGCVSVGLVDGEYVVNPTKAQEETSKLKLVVAGTKNNVLMIEGNCDFLTEAQLVDAIKIGQSAISDICEGLESYQQRCGKPKRVDSLRELPAGLVEKVQQSATDKIKAAFHAGGDKNVAGYSATKKDLEKAFALLKKEVIDELTSAEDTELSAMDIGIALKQVTIDLMRRMVLDEGVRADGRKTDQVRPIDIQTTYLPCTHGSAIFTRGETQALATATVGDNGMQQRYENLDGSGSKKFYLHYSFPPSSVGEVGRTGAPGRREVGHGNLAEAALRWALPSAEDWGYSCRVESFITESCGSSSMASVCGGCLALLDAGVPLKSPVAGVAMGLMLDESDKEEHVILTDILGLEDALGTMDFKVAGDADGITAFQLDIKCEGLTMELLEKALGQAKQGRLHILDEMKIATDQLRGKGMADSVPRILTVTVPSAKVSMVIGKGGSTVKGLIEEYGLSNINIEDDGTIMVSSPSELLNEAAKQRIMDIVKDDSGWGKGRGGGKGAPPPDKNAEPLEVGKIYTNCPIVNVMPFGAIVDLGGGNSGFCHISEISSDWVKDISAVVKMGDSIDVQLLEINDKGQCRLSRKSALLAAAATEETLVEGEETLVEGEAS